ncbi:MAG: DUF2459 domain-containing protein [Geminicoccaceae bacterium]
MRSVTTILPWLFCAILLANCTPLPPLPLSSPGPNIYAVSIVSDGWHAAIVVRRAQLIETGLVPEAGDFPKARFIEFGWGDRAYYPAREKTLGMTLDAALRATPAIIHIAGRIRSPELVYGDANVVSIAVNRQTFRHMIGVLDGYFDREDGSRSHPVAPGIHPNSNFYLARGGFHLFNNCNTWTAHILRAGGVNLSPAGVITAGQLMSQLRAKIGSSQPSRGGALPSSNSRNKSAVPSENRCQLRSNTARTWCQESMPICLSAALRRLLARQPFEQLPL